MADKTEAGAKPRKFEDYPGRWITVDGARIWVHREDCGCKSCEQGRRASRLLSAMLRED